MTKIAIVDDSQELLDKVKCLVKSYMGTAGRLFRVWCCTNPAALVSSILDGDRFDIYILDVEMPGSNGLEVAERIRELQPVAKIIFLTSYLDYATKGYAVHALRYILKQNMDKDLPEALETALKSLDDANCACLMVSHYNNITRILHKDIMYVRKEHRSLQIFTTEQGVVSDSRGIKEVFGLLHNPAFAFIERSCFINLNFARAMEGCWMVMKQGERLPISRPMLPKVKDTIMRLWGG